LIFDYDALLVSLIKQIAGAIWDADLKFWKIASPTPISAKQLLDLAELYGFEFDAQVLFKLTSLITEGTQTMLRSMSSTSSFHIEGLKQQPYPYQVGGIEFGIQQKRILIADQMGLGKTIEAIGIISHLKLYPACIICPAIVRLNWQREYLAWDSQIDPQKIAILIGRTPYKLPEAQIYILNYDILPWWTETLLKLNLKALVYDEIHYAKNGSSKRGRASRVLSKNCEYVIGLTGTPILNKPVELVNPLRILGRLDEMGGKTYFERRYCEAGRDNFGRWNTSGASNLKELNDRLRSTGIFIRRLKKDVLADLPRKLPPTIIPIELTNRTDYNKAEKDFAIWLGQRAVEDVSFKSSISRLSPIEKVRRIAQRRATIEWRARQNEELQKFSALKRLATQGKFEGMKDHLNNFLESQEKIVVFGWFVDTQHDLVVQWPEAVHALGKDSDVVRNEAIDRFQTDPDIKMLIASLKAIGIGVNLTAAHYVALVELGWTPADMDQAIDRLDRIGQKFPVNVYYYIGVGTVEEDIIDIIDRKRRIVGVATDGLSVTDEDVRKTLIGRLLRKYKNETDK
jgi:SWI/SNF-related matrix-associated actin-dependent regulator 1 of chromatin subfamily A